MQKDTKKTRKKYSKLSIKTISLPDFLVKQIDNLVKKGKISSRSQFVRDAIHNTIPIIEKLKEETEW